jgi:CDP-glucose 4,6-dehydratase
VEDAVAAGLLLAEKLSGDGNLVGEAFNFSHELPMTALDIVRRVLARMGSRLEPDIHNEATQEIPRQFLSARKARERLGWRPMVDLDQGLDRTIAWYGEHFGREDAIRARAA